MPQRLSHLYDDTQRFLLTEHLPRRKVVIQCLALDELHHKVVIPPRLADVHRLNDIGMIQLARRLALFVKTLHVVLILGEPLRQNLNRNVPVQAKLPRPVNNSHCACADFTQNLISRYLMSCGNPLRLPYGIPQPMRLCRRNVTPLKQQVHKQNRVVLSTNLHFLNAPLQLLTGAKPLLYGHLAEYRIVIGALVTHLSLEFACPLASAGNP